MKIIINLIKIIKIKKIKNIKLYYKLANLKKIINKFKKII